MAGTGSGGEENFLNTVLAPVDLSVSAGAGGAGWGCWAGSYLVALPGQLVFDTSSGCVPVKAPAAVVLPRSWYSSHAVA